MGILKFKNIKLLVTVILILFVSSMHDIHAQFQPSREYQIKGAFIYNFLDFVEWTTNCSVADKMPIYILGADPFGSIFDEIADKKARIKTLSPENISSCSDINSENCFIVFISSSEIEKLDQTLDAISGLGVLTIGDTKGFAKRGVVINFLLEKNKVRFEINSDAANRAGLKISSKLLRLARKVYSKTK